jgi:hypothetical protein
MGTWILLVLDSLDEKEEEGHVLSFVTVCHFCHLSLLSLVLFWRASERKEREKIPSH